MGGAVNPAKLNKRITIQRRSSARDADGAQLAIWTDVCTVSAHIRPLNSRELQAAQAVQQSTSHEITIRYHAGINGTMRALYCGRIFNLGPPRNVDERNVELIIPATEGMNAG